MKKKVINNTNIPEWDNMNPECKKGMVLTGYVKCNNNLIRAIINQTDIYCGAVYIALLSHYNTLTRECSPTVETLARETKISDRKIRYSIQKLKELKIITTAKGGERNTKQYCFPLEADHDKIRIN